MESQYFIFDGINSTDMNLYLIRMDTGFIENPYWGGQDIVEEKVAKRDNPYFYRVDRQPIEFTVQFVLADENMIPQKWTPQKRNEIARWLLHDTYKPFQTTDDLGKIYNVICTNPNNLYTLGNTEGYIELTFRADAFHAYTPTYISEFDMSDNATTKIIELSNLSNIKRKYYPKFEVELVGDSTGFSFRNLSNGGLITSFSDLQPLEIVSVDNKNKWIISSVPLVYRFQNFNKNWFYLVEGTNRIEITGAIKVAFKSRFPIAQ